jgi:cob(I)alamin adenosyltransferase
LGLALRASGAGLRTLVLQYMKGQHYGELNAVKSCGGLITIEQYGSPEFCRIDDERIMEHVERARKALVRSREALSDASFQVLVLDEIVTAYLYKLVTLRDIADLIQSKPDGKELILTGRGAPPALVEICDLVTEMKEVKHYFNAGVEAREGIEY